MELSMVAKEGTIDRKITDLVNIRASQLNQCTFCVDMHSKEAKIHGEQELRVYHIPVWREPVSVMIYITESVSTSLTRK